jgi:cell division protein FtsW
LRAFGRGEITGIGLGDGIQKLFYLPEAHNDFIFAVIAEELGLVGAVFVIGLLGFMVLRGFRIARKAVDADRAFAGYLAYGASLLIGSQVLINVGVNTGVLPTKGLTLPFISYGGNSLLVCSMLMGLIQRASFEVSTRTTRGLKS